jgi:hypothetical protein
MNRSKILLGGLLTIALIAPAMPALADRKQHVEHHANPGKHLGWDKTAGKKFDEHDRRYYRHPDPRFYHRDVRYDRYDNHGRRDWRYERRPDPRFYHRDSVRNADLRQDYSELRKDRMELHRDLRNGASKTEILKDRQEIRNDMKDIHGDRLDLRHGR